VAIGSGGLATSSTTLRQWWRGGRRLHHIIDPFTGAPAATCWRTASVAAATCVDANAAATAALVWGAGALDRLRAAGAPARLVGGDGTVRTVAGWPADQRSAA
jgi:thiamine biosynthesis lipoprotein